MWWGQLESQLDDLLHSPDIGVQEPALQHIICFAKHYADRVDLSRSAAKILNIYERDTREGRRI